MVETNRIEFKRELTDDLDVEMVESLGSGMPRILQTYGRECFTFMEHFIRFTIPFNNNVTDNVIGDKHENIDKLLSDRQKRIVEAMKSDMQITTTELAAMFSVTQRTIKRDIDFLKKHDKIKRMGNEKSGYWLVLI